MASLNKKDCISMQDAQKALGVSRMTLYNYLNALGIQRHTFPFDRRFYITHSDYGRVKEFKETREI